MQRARVALEIVPPVAPRETGEFDVVAAPEAALDFESVFKRYSPYVAAVAHRLLGRDADVDDTVQEVFMVAVRGLSRVRDPLAVKSWLARIAVRVSRRKLQMRRVRSFFGVDDPAAYDVIADDQASPEQRALLQRVYRVLDSLPADQRIAWTLRHIEGEQLDAVAALSGCSLATAKRRISAAARTLEEAFSDG
ncbi:MAG TPA: sigma-70 family RNA polymerase sigma factor [Polyangiaceae bacterium]|nr:sigma-70 family RNA polymerase sigma factor [Polyangiaceae bacterium]